MEKINWLEWSGESFEKAKQEDKPVLLDIHGVWCHWCHVQDESYLDPIVIELVNKKFIPIKVDTDKRPDINERYNQGGWPTTAFLTPDGMLITGATYVPPAELASMLEQVANYYARNKDDFKLETHKNKPEKGKIKSVIDDVLEEILKNFDAEYGGFGVQPKFPFPDAVELAMLKYRMTKDNSFLALATKTLDGILGLFDNVGGGFYRYSVTRSWDLPHYEKMLETNAQLIVNYVQGFQLTGDQRYKETATRTAEFLLTVLHGTDGFYGSQDADREEEYYGKSLEERMKMPIPCIDRNIYVNLNAITISALLCLGTLDKKYQKIALENLDNIIGKCHTTNGMCHYYDGKQNIFGLLIDNIYTVRALLDAYEITSRTNCIEKAEELMEFVVRNFFDDSFADKIKNKDDIGLLSIQKNDINHNSVAADCLIRLAFYTNKENYLKTAQSTLETFSNDYKRYGLHAALYAMVVEKFLNKIEITVSDIKYTEPFQALHDPRIMIKSENDKERFSGGHSIYICYRQKCLRFKDFDEAKKFLMVLE